MSFESLGDSLRGYVNEQFGVYENVPTNPGNPYDYTKLGPFQQAIDKSEERRYVQDGSRNNIRPRNLEILMQNPEAVLVIKKRHFSSLAENYRYDLMNDQEKNYIKALKRLFYNKCRLIAAHERLSKIEKIAKASGGLNSYTLSQVYSSVDTLNTLSPGLISGSTLATLDFLKNVKNLSDPNEGTTWVNTSAVPYLADVGEGTGVIELTTLSSFQTTVSTRFGEGSGSFNIEDPNKIMVISSLDIEKAISDTSGITNNPFFNSTAGLLDESIKDLQSQLTKLRISRSVPQIKFLQNSNSLLFKRIRAIIDEEGREIIFTYDGGVLGFNSAIQLDASATLGANGLSLIEVPIFTQIIQNMYLSMGLEDSRRNTIKEFNEGTNFIRDRLMLEFDNKCIVGVNDVVHLFVSSQTSTDARIAQGFNASWNDNILSKINTAIGSVDSSIENIVAGFSGSKDSFIAAEKDAIAGPDFPLWLWTLLRSEFTRSSVGPQIFSGVVDNVTHNSNGGFYGMTISAKDNCHYLNMGQLNIKPSVSVIDSSLYDPLTPFKINYDLSTGLINGEIPPLLDENVALINSGCVKFSSGRNKGLKFQEDTYNIRDVEILTPENVASSKFRNKMHDPAGMVYRWKQGIGTLTAAGAPHAFGTGSLRNETSPVITNDPFAGQDVMNVLSLLVTGQPYNFNTFMKSSVNSGMITRDELFNQSWSESFLKGLISDISKSNSVWGNFVPFKKMIINNEAYNFLRSGEFDITTATRKISQLLSDRSERFDQLTTIFPDLANNPQFYKVDVNGKINVDTSILSGLDKNSITNLAKDIIDLDYQIQQQQNFFQEESQRANIRTADGALRIVGDDITYDPTLTDQDSALTENDQRKAQESFRKKIFELTQRRFFKVKANQDINYFIVDDSYDKNYDIQAFESSIAGALSTFKSTYTKIGDQAKMVSDLLGLELFADSQGHINARPPMYNRIPSSVMYEMLKKKNVQGVQIFPKYLESLFYHQVQGLTSKIEVLEDQIRLRTTALGSVDDSASADLLSGSSMPNVSASSLRFIFLTTENDGKLGGQSLRNLLMQAEPDFAQEINQQALSELSSSLQYPNNSQINFDIVKRVSVTNSVDTFDLGAVSGDSLSLRFETITARLKNQNISVPTFADLLPNNKSAIGRGISQIDIFSLTQQLASLIAERQGVIKLLSGALKNLNQGIQVNADIDPAKGSLLSSINKDVALPQILEHMIEDESVDDLGEGSGKRYIIKDVDIISFSLSEKGPDWTVAEVNGSIANNLVQGASGLEIGQSGNFVSSALAVDYDMWRQYGFRGHNAVSMPLLSDPESQCGPYAVWLLNQARKKIFTGSLTSRGNEYLQAGEVSYIVDRDLLMYNESVSTSFTYGQSFTSSINLTFAHKPGQFIPTPLDIIGKGLYTNRNQADLIKHVRNDDPSGNIPITVIVSDNTETGNVDDDNLGEQDQMTQLVSNSFGIQNRQNLATLALSTSGLLTPTRDTNSLSIEIRLYYNSDLGFDAPDLTLSKFAASIQSWLANPSKFSLSSNSPSVISDNQNNVPIDATQVQIVEIDLATSSESPSSQAWSIARSLAINSTSATISQGSDIVNPEGLSQAERDNLFYKVIDIWAVFSEPPVETLDSFDQSTDPQSQADQMMREKYLKNFSEAINATS